MKIMVKPSFLLANIIFSWLNSRRLIKSIILYFYCRFFNNHINWIEMETMLFITYYIGDMKTKGGS